MMIIGRASPDFRKPSLAIKAKRRVVLRAYLKKRMHGTTHARSTTSRFQQRPAEAAPTRTLAHAERQYFGFIGNRAQENEPLRRPMRKRTEQNHHLAAFEQ